MPLSFDLIAEAAAAFGAAMERSSALSATMQLPLRHVDGVVEQYWLNLTIKGDEVAVREVQPYHLPAFCPERHINLDGTFCLYFPDADKLQVVDAESATIWMDTLWAFLKLQRRAKTARRWPNGNAWAHGAAARHQLHAQLAATELGLTMAEALKQSQLTVRHRQSQQRDVLQVMNGELHIFSVWESTQRFVNQKRRCFCGASGKRIPKRVRTCTDHARQAVTLAVSLFKWKQEEERFWSSLRNRSCCGSCDGCPLQRNPAPVHC